MGWYLAIGGVVGALIVAVPMGLFELRTPRDVEWAILIIAFTPLYLLVGPLLITMGLAKTGVVLALAFSNALFYAALGWWLWHSRGRPPQQRFTPMLAGFVGAHCLGLAIEAFR